MVDKTLEERRAEHYKYLLEKKSRVLKMLKPIMKGFGIKNYDYLVTETLAEWLVIGDVKIGCAGNSEFAILQELTGYLFIKLWSGDRYLGNYKNSVLKHVREFWRYSNE